MDEQINEIKILQIKKALNAFFTAESLEQGWEAFQAYPELLNGEAESYLTLILENLSNKDQQKQIQSQRDFLSRTRLEYFLHIFLNSETWNTAVSFILDHPDLLREATDHVLQKWEKHSRARKDIKYADFLSEKRRFLKLSREIGVINVFADIISKNDFLEAIVTFVDVEEWDDAKLFLESHLYLLSKKATEAIDFLISRPELDDTDRPTLIRFVYKLHRELLEKCNEKGIDNVFSNLTEPTSLYRIMRKLEAIYRKNGNFEDELEKYPEIFTQDARVFVKELMQQITEKSTISFFELLIGLQFDAEKHGIEIAHGKMKLNAEKKKRQDYQKIISKLGHIDANGSIDDLLDLLREIADSPSIARDFRNVQKKFIDSENFNEDEGGLPRLILPEDHPYSKIWLDANKLPNDIWLQIISLMSPVHQPHEITERLNIVLALLNHLDKHNTPCSWAYLQDIYGGLLIQGAKNDEMIEQGIHAHRAALEIFTKNETPFLWASANGSLGIGYYRRTKGDKAENIDKAIDSFLHALEVMTPEKFPNNWGAMLINLAASYMARTGSNEQENLEKAIHIYKQILSTNTLKEAPEFWAGVQNNLGLALYTKTLLTKDKDEKVITISQSVQHFKNALVFYSEADLPIDWGMAKLNLGHALLQRNLIGDIKLAMESYTDALTIFKLSEFPEVWAKTSISLANASQANGDTETSIKIYIDVVNNCQQSYLKLFRFVSAGQLGIIYYLEEQWDFAYQYLKMSIQTLDNIRLDAFTNDTRLYFNAAPSYFYKFLIEVCIKLGYFREAFENIEASKSRIFLEELGTHNSFSLGTLPSSVRKELLEKEEELLHDLRRIENSLRQPLNYSVRRELVSEQENLAVALDELWDELEKDYPDYVMMRRGSPAKYETISKFLKDTNKKIALVEYYDIFNTLVAFVVKPDMEEPIYIELGLTSIDIHKAVRQYLNDIVKRYQLDESEYWLNFSSNLFGKVYEKITDVDIVYIVPHGYLHIIPFYALRVKERSLIDLFTLISSPSATTLERINHRDDSRSYSPYPKALVIGDPTFELTYALKEAQQIATIFDVKPYLSVQASKKVVIKECIDKDILHFASHGYFDPENPMYSGIVLANNEPFTAIEIMNVSLTANLVTLSACLTGLSKINDGDELEGLSRAFLYAGASSLLVSLWPIHDETTADLMIEFYNRLMIQHNYAQSKSQALRDAMLAIRSKHPEPYFWAPFMLIGSM